MTDNPHYVTPEEAKEKYCPQPDFTYCLGSKCMAWRWKHKPSKVYHWWATEREPFPPKEWMKVDDLHTVDDRLSGVFMEAPTHGYCGMVGQ